MPDRKIIGIALVKNEEHFVEWAIGNALEFCDEIIVLDNMSEDETFEKVSNLSRNSPKIRVSRIDDPNMSHRFIEQYAGTQTWIFGVDGDEIYDPNGLSQIRRRIMSGEFDQYWEIKGHVLHATALELGRGWAQGYSTPAAKSMVKLYNFSALISWKESKRERLHGGSQVFRPGYSRWSSLALQDKGDWDNCELRCLHLCFVPRTSLDPSNPLKRRNPAENKASRRRNLLRGFKEYLFGLGRKERGGYKAEKYMRGSIIERDIRSFGTPRDLEAAPTI
ncbi:hypothetical protein EH220_01715 [bacterium]|nr:MAG: hypothetical protein EH220_01715 [bacterium]